MHLPALYCQYTQLLCLCACLQNSTGVFCGCLHSTPYSCVHLFMHKCVCLAVVAFRCHIMHLCSLSPHSVTDCWLLCVGWYCLHVWAWQSQKSSSICCINGTVRKALPTWAGDGKCAAGSQTRCCCCPVLCHYSLLLFKMYTYLILNVLAT